MESKLYNFSNFKNFYILQSKTSLFVNCSSLVLLLLLDYVIGIHYCLVSLLKN